MAPEHDDVPDREKRLSAILVACLEAIDRGETRNREQLQARYPEFADEVNQFLDDQERVARCAAPLRAVAAVVAKGAREGKDSSDTVAEVVHAERTGAVRRLGDYELLEEIGRGGMATVYRARQGGLGRTVAVKVIRAADGTSRREAERFRREAELAAHLDHPHIVPVYEVGEQDGYVYFSMKLIEGGSLAMSLDRFTPDPRAAARLVAAVARAVHHAHQRGVLHRDLKPANILLDEAGQPHITDFGLGRRVEGDSSLTQSGTLVGTPSYMSPEQTAGERAAVTTAADVYGLGAVLYALLTGRPPFRADTAVDTMLLVREQEPESPRRSNGRVDRDLGTICVKCLEKEPQRRYGSVEALAEDLERWLKGESIQGRRVGLRERLWKWVKRRPALAALLTLSTVAVIGGVGGIVWHNAELRAAAKRESEQADRARRERDAAEQEQRWARQAVDDMYTKVATRWLPAEPRLQRLRREFLEKALAYYERIAARGNVGSSIRAELAMAYGRVGTIQLMLGHHDQAQQALRRAIAVQEAMSGPSPKDTADRARLCGCYHDLAISLNWTGRFEQAQPVVQRCIDLAVAWLAASPGRAEPLKLAAGAYNDLGRLLNGQGRYADAARAYQQAVAYTRKRATVGRQDAKFGNDLAGYYNNVAEAYRRAGEGPQAEKAYRQALAIREKMAKVFPGQGVYELACLCNNLANFLEPNRQSEAVALVRRALPVLEKLAADNPALPLYRDALGRSYTILANAFDLRTHGREMARPREAEHYRRDAIRIFEALARDAPNVPRYQELLGNALWDLARQLALKHPPPAEVQQARRRALDIYQRLVAEHPSSPEHRSTLADLEQDLAFDLLVRKQPRQAEALYRQSRSRLERLVKDFPGVAAYQASLADLLLHCPVTGVRDPAQAHALAKRALKLAPEERYWWYVSAMAEYRAGHWAACRELLEARERREDGGASGRFFLAMACWQLGEKQEARRWYNKAAQWMDRNKPFDVELTRFRAEAARLLGIQDGSPGETRNAQPKQ